MPVKIRVERLSLGGDGVGHLVSKGSLDQKVAFVPYSLPGEVVEAQLLFDKKNHSRWLPISVQNSSANRIQPPCPHHFVPGRESACGGCDWQHLAPEFQKKTKADLLKETLVRLGGLTDPPLRSLLAGPKEWRYRNKIQVPFGKRQGRVVAGFFAPGSHDIVEFEDCLIQPELSVQLIQAVKNFANLSRWNPYDENRHQGWLRHVLVRTNEAGEALLVLVVTSDKFPDRSRFVEELKKKFPSLLSVFLNIQTARTHVILGRIWIRLWGKDRIEEKILGLRLAYSPASFFQVNTLAAELLYKEAIDQLEPQNTSVVLDVYCGVGALTFLAAKRARFAIGVEEAPSSIRDAGWNARQNGISNVKFVEGPAERVLQRPDSLWGEYLKTEDLLALVDPPRSGCRPEVLQALGRLRPRRIVYVSCDPATLARDIKILSTHYRISTVTPVDLFPQTSHIEAVARLDKI